MVWSYSQLAADHTVVFRRVWSTELTCYRWGAGNWSQVVAVVCTLGSTVSVVRVGLRIVGNPSPRPVIRMYPPWVTDTPWVPRATQRKPNVSMPELGQANQGTIWITIPAPPYKVRPFPWSSGIARIHWLDVVFLLVLNWGCSFLNFTDTQQYYNMHWVCWIS